MRLLAARRAPYTREDDLRPVPPRESWATNGGVRLHVLESGRGRAGTPVLFVPGMMGTAEDHGSEMDFLAPRRCVAASLRGRGRSDAPETGYSFKDHVGDLEAVVRHARLRRFHIVGYSVGAAYAIGYATRHPANVRGLVIGDYPARYPRFPEGWVPRALAAIPGASEVAVRSLQRESAAIPLWPALSRLRGPVLVLRGDGGSLLTAYGARQYRQRASGIEVVVLPGAHHDLWNPDRGRYLRTLASFLAKADAR